MNKRIVFLADCLVTQKAGIHFYTKQFIRRVTQAYPDNKYFIVLESPYGGFNIEEIIVKTNKMIPMHFRLRSLKAIPQAVNKLKADVVIEMAHFGPFNIKKPTKKITVIHDLTPIIFPKWHDRASHIVHKQFMPSVIKNADYIITNSEKTKKDVLAFQKKSPDKVLVSYPQINFQESKLKIILPKKYLLSVGTIEPRKNYLTLIKAFEEYAEEDKEMQLLIVGYKGWKSEDVLQLVASSKHRGRIQLLGYIEDEKMIQLYQGAFAFVYPTYYEGFGLPLLEAMNYENAIIASDIDICREVCQDAALYFDKHSHFSLKNKLSELNLNAQLHQELCAKSIDRAQFFQKNPVGLEVIFQ